jgi:hypothetical protein
MFLHIGRDRIVNYNDIIGIFDIETATVSKITREYLSSAPDKELISVTDELPKSFIVCAQKSPRRKSGLKPKNQDNTTLKVYISQISSSTLKKRLEIAEASGELLHDKGLAEE